MLFTAGAIALLATVSRVAAQCSACVNGCVADSCFRVLAGDQFFAGAETVSHCRSYLWTHSTWASVTVTETETVSSGAVTQTATETLVVVIEEGITTTRRNTVETVTATVTQTSGTAPLGSFTTTVVNPLRKRQAGGPIPDYASDCGGASGYSSACWCIGVTYSGTTYTEVPTITETVTSGIPSTVVVTETFSEFTTQTGTAVVATQNDDVTGTATEIVIYPSVSSFIIQATDDEANGNWKGQFFKAATDSSSNGLRRISLVADASGATVYHADSSGVITDSTGVGFAASDQDAGAQLWQSGTGGGANFQKIDCVLTTDLLVSCTSVGRNFLAVDTTSNAVRAFTHLGQIWNLNSQGPLVLKAVPQGSTGVPPAVAKSVQIRARADSAYYPGQYLGTGEQVDGTDGPYPRVRFYELATDAVKFVEDPVNGNLMGENHTPFVADDTNPTEQFWLMPKVGTKVVFSMTHEGIAVRAALYSVVRYLAAANTTSGGTSFFRVYEDQAQIAQDKWLGPLALETVDAA